MTRITLLLIAVSVLAACSQSQTAPAADHAHSPYTCVHETDRLPAIESQANQLYRYGKYLENQLSSSSGYVTLDRFTKIARYYRLAAAYGDYRANLALMDLLYKVKDDGYDNVSTPWRMQREDEAARLLRQLVAENIPAGFDRLGGFASQEWNLPAALSYYRKAADLGNPHAQFQAAEMLNPSTIIGMTAKATREDAKVADSLYRCAAEQGYGDAISTIGRALLQDGKRDEAILVFHRGIAKGDVGSASALEDLFAQLQKSSKGTSADAERVSRYEAIRVFLIDHRNAGVTLPDVEKIVPLPPARLPAWNGTFQWALDNETANANPPDKPSEQLVQRLSRDKHLDPHTGLPLA